jgi:hypothetical protein
VPEVIAAAKVDADEKPQGRIAHVAVGRRNGHRDEPTVANAFGERAHDLAGASPSRWNIVQTASFSQLAEVFQAHGFSQF